MDVLLEAQKKRDVLIAQLQLQIRATVISSFESIMEDQLAIYNKKFVFMIDQGKPRREREKR